MEGQHASCVFMWEGSVGSAGVCEAVSGDRWRRGRAWLLAEVGCMRHETPVRVEPLSWKFGSVAPGEGHGTHQQAAAPSDGLACIS